MYDEHPCLLYRGLKFIREGESINDEDNHFQMSDLLLCSNFKFLSLFHGLLRVFLGPYPWPTLSPALTAATLPTPVSKGLDPTGTLPPVTAPANKTTTTLSLEEATTVVLSLFF